MGLPVELVAYAENIYRRFPEEFVALGQPGLEAIYDLRVDGTKSRKIVESASEKTVSITIKRWPNVNGGLSQAGYAGYAGYAAPYMPGMPGMPGTTGLPGQLPQMPQPFLGAPLMPGAFGTQPSACGAAPPPFGSSYPPPPAPAPAVQQLPPPAACRQSSPGTASTNAQLQRLETMLLALKPQVEAALVNQGTDDSGGFGRSKVISLSSSFPGDRDQSALSTPSPLRDRRRMQQLSIVAPENAKSGGDKLVRDNSVKLLPQVEGDGSSAEEPEKAKIQASAGTGSSSNDVQPPAREGVVKLASAAEVGEATVTTNGPQPVGNTTTPSNKFEGVKKERGMTINAVRIAKLAQDPESPRSPGKHSAWK